MPIGAINWNNTTKSLVLRGAGPLRGSSQYFSCRLDGSDIYIDDSPVVDDKRDETDSTKKTWDTTAVNEIKVVTVKGTRDAKRATAVAAFQRYVFDTIVFLADLALDDADHIADPDSNNMFWCDEDGVKNPSGLWVNSRANILVDFVADDFDNGILTASIRKVS